MKEVRENVCRELKDWLDKTALNSVLLFGSLIHRDGVQFDLQESDIDTIATFPKNIDYLARWRTLKEIEDSVAHLNLVLLKEFGRLDASQPIVSIVPVSAFELENGIHKDKAPQFFSHNDFLDVCTLEIGPVGKELKSIKAKIDGALDSIREAQRYRNQFLAIAPSGKRFVSDYSGPDVLPKKIARCAAQVRWAREVDPKDDQRYDLNEGLVYVLQLITSRRNEHSSIDDILQRLIIRMGGRGESGPLTPVDQLLLWEVLVDDAIGLFPLAPPPAKPRKPISEKTKQLALQRAGYRCSYPGCKVPLGSDGIGEIAHISRGSVRGIRDSVNMSLDDENSLDNLIVLCPTHHRIIDSHPEEYTTTILKGWNQTIGDEIIKQFTSKNLFTIVKHIADIIT